MSTINSIAIFHTSIDKVVHEIEEVFIIGRRRNKDYSHEYEFFFEENLDGEYALSDSYSGGTVMVVHKEMNYQWVQIDYDISHNVYVLDELLRVLTLKLGTYAFLAYNQTTSGDFRFAFFNKGAIKRSIFIKNTDFNSDFRIIDNFGAKFEFENIDYPIPFTKPTDLRYNYEIFNLWLPKIGFIGNDGADNKYLHLEILNFKN